jgi:uncharacterized protein
MANSDCLTVSVVFSPTARQVNEKVLSVHEGATVAEALQASGLLTGLTAAQADALQVSVWGRHAPLNSPLREQDRIEVCRPLTVDPKVARRERFAQQGARTAGLFSRRRPGAKAGY